VADPADGIGVAPLQLPKTLRATLVLVRHAESVWVAEGRFQGRSDPPLSELGERQARLVAERLAATEGLPIPAGGPAAIWHSPLRRAADTARLIAGYQPAVQLRSSDDLTELGQGEWEGLLHTEVGARWPAELARWRTDPTSTHAPGGESLAAAASRVRSCLAALTEELAGRGEAWAIVVAHDGILRLVLMTLLGIPYGRFWSFPFSLCAISVIALADGVASLRAHNLADHLASLATTERGRSEASGDRAGAL
jgi:phosphoserine phosphatase